MSMTTGRIVVGVDDSEENIAALVWAIRQARASGATIEAVYAFQVALPVPYSPTVRAPADEVAAEAQAALDQVIAARAEEAPRRHRRNPSGPTTRRPSRPCCTCGSVPPLR